MIFGFDKSETDSEDEVAEVMQIIINYFKNRFQVFGVIQDGSANRIDDYLHIHLGVNPVSYVDGSRLPESDEMYYRLAEYLNRNTRFSWNIIFKSDMG